MSWIVRDLWSSLQEKRNEYRTLLDTNLIRTFEVINRIAYDVGQRYGILLQLNFPPGSPKPRMENLGHRDLSMLIARGRERFTTMSEPEVKTIFERLKPLLFEPLHRNQDGFKVRLSNGRIDCLPSGVHLWCEITPEVLDVVDSLFTNVYGLKPI